MGRERDPKRGTGISRKGYRSCQNGREPPYKTGYRSVPKWRDKYIYFYGEFQQRLLSYIQREKKNLYPTEQGKELILVLPDIVKSPKLTADWENKLTLVAKGELSDVVFMGGIDAMIRALIAENKEPKAEYRALFPQKAACLGICPHCGEKVLKGKFGAYCSGKCGMNVSMYYGMPFSDEQVTDLLNGKKILLKGLIGKNGKPYDMYLEPKGIEEYSYEKNGKEIGRCWLCGISRAA